MIMKYRTRVSNYGGKSVLGRHLSCAKAELWIISKTVSIVLNR